MIRLFGGDPRDFGRNKDIDLLSIAEVDFQINAKISYRPVAEIRDQASACHASQGGQYMNRGPLGWFRRLFSANETFMRAFPPPDGKRIEKRSIRGFVKKNREFPVLDFYPWLTNLDLNQLLSALYIGQ